MATLHYNSLSYPLESIYIFIVTSPKQDANFVVFNIPAGFVLLMMLYNGIPILPQCIRTQQAIQLNSIKIETFAMHFDALFWFGSNSGKFVKFRWFVTQRKQIKTIRVIAFQLLQLGFQVFRFSMLCLCVLFTDTISTRLKARNSAKGKQNHFNNTLDVLSLSISCDKTSFKKWRLLQAKYTPTAWSQLICQTNIVELKKPSLSGLQCNRQAYVTLQFDTRKIASDTQFLVFP